MEQKQFRVRIEDMESGVVEEFETNCLSVVNVEETGEEDSFHAQLRNYQNCTNKCRISLLKALRTQLNELEKKIVSSFKEFVSENTHVEADA